MAARRRERKGGGLGRVKEAVNRKGKGQAEWVKWEDGDIRYVRVVGPWEDGYVHRTPMEREDGSTYHADVPCLDQDDKGVPCPGCAEDLSRRYKFWTNVIVRGDEEKDEKDKVMIWSSGITVAKRLDKLDAKFGIKNRDLEVEREGAKKDDTTYDIEAATDEDEELTDDDEQLAKKLFDLKRYSEPPEFDDFFKSPGERRKDDEDEDPAGSSLRRGSGFKKRKKDEDDDEDDKPVTRRKSTVKSKKSSGSAKPTVKRRRR